MSRNVATRDGAGGVAELEAAYGAVEGRWTRR